MKNKEEKKSQKSAARSEISETDLQEIREAAENSEYKIRHSKIFLSVLTESFKSDPIACLQLGIAIMLDKPIAIIAFDDVSIPENLRKVAKFIEPTSKGILKETVERVVKNMETMVSE